MSHAQGTWLDRILLPPHHSTPSFLDSSHGRVHCDTHHGGQFGRLAIQGPFASYEPNDPVEVSSTVVTTMLLPSRRVSIGSTYNSGEDIAAAPASSEVDKRQHFGKVGSTAVYTGEGEAGAAPSRIFF